MLLELKFIHGTNGTEIEIEVEDDVTLQEILEQLAAQPDPGFINPGHNWQCMLKLPDSSRLLDNTLSLKANNVPTNGSIILNSVIIGG